MKWGAGNMMECLKKITVVNVKGKDKFEVDFVNLVPNKVNIVVAPNGYGKSTITKAIAAAKSGSMKLDKVDIYENNENNKPALELTFGNKDGQIYISDTKKGEISRKMNIFTINSPVFAKSQAAVGDNHWSQKASLFIKPVELYKKIPTKCDLEYKVSDFQAEFGPLSVKIPNIKKNLSDYRFVKFLWDNMELLKRCCSSKKLFKAFGEFVESLKLNDGKSNIVENVIGETIYNDEEIRDFCDNISVFSRSKYESVECLLILIQICKLLKVEDKFNKEKLKNYYLYLNYKHTRKSIDELLKEFFPGNRVFKTKKEKDKLVVNLSRAERLSNGERDVLYFLIELKKFQLDFSKNVGLLVIDEVFDYLDGSNMLVAQYQLSKLVEECKQHNKKLFLIIFTHLDPELFKNYCFSKMQVHYLLNKGSRCEDSSIVKLIQYREKMDKNTKSIFDKYFVHYNNNNYNKDCLDKQIQSLFPPQITDSFRFREAAYEEVCANYLTENTNKIYNPIFVVIGIRLKIEELIWQKLNNNQKDQFMEKRTTEVKLKFAELDCKCDVPELYYLLRPIYNDALHIDNTAASVSNKIKSCLLKLDNQFVRNLIGKVFESTQNK